VLYVADGRVVPSPLSKPSCHNCEGHVVRIMRAGQVSSVRGTAQHHSVPQAGPVEAPAVPAVAVVPQVPREPHHWHLSDLLHPFQRKAS
jgi:hypothetical protein